MSIERKTHEFGHPSDPDFVRVKTVEDPLAKEFGARTWVAAEILASHLHRHWHARYRRGDPTDETRVLELGAGTSLPGLVLAELGARVVLTDTIEEGCVLGNVHAMSHPAGAQYGIHHGLANAILLPYVMEFNLPARLEKFAQIAEALGADTSGMDLREAAQAAVDAVWELNGDLRIPTKLSAYGVKRAGIKRMSAAAMTSGNVTVNPRKTEQADIEALFSEAI